MTEDKLTAIVVDALEDLKAKDIVVLDVRKLTDMADYMVIASGTSARHVKSLAENAALEAKKKGSPALGIEGDNVAEWVLVDFGDVLLHVMLPETREFYALEKLWQVGANKTES